MTYPNTRFNVAQLTELFFHQQLPATFVSQRGHKASSEEAFIITLTKITRQLLTTLGSPSSGILGGRQE
jgi:hypothetical protein